LKLCFLGSHTSASGLCSSGATTDTGGSCLLRRTASWVWTRPSVMESSWYMIDCTVCWPRNGPPARIWRSTPVLPSGPVYVPFLASSLPLAPISEKYAPYSASGNQSVWSTIVDGHTPVRSVVGTALRDTGAELPALPNAA